MASPVNAALCALVATGFWSLIGYALARHLLPRILSAGAAGIVGWAAHSSVALPMLRWIGLTQITVVGSGLLCILAAGFSLSLPTAENAVGTVSPPARPLLFACAGAALLAVIPAAALLPKFHGGTVQLSDPIFDHAKVAIIDAIARLGLPPVNPFYGAEGGLDRLPYYYLWHFSAAEIALTLGVKGWEADIGTTWFTAFASLTLMMGLAVWLAERWAAAVWVIALATAGSLWVTLYFAFHPGNLVHVLLAPIGMAGWLFQASWAPQHLMAGGCTVVAILLLTRSACAQTPVLILALAVVIAAAFESSTFVGGLTFAIAALSAAPILFIAMKPSGRLRIIAGFAVAAVLVIGLVAPFLLDQLGALRARHLSGSPIIVSPYAVFGEAFPTGIRRILDLPAYWLVVLPFELPAAFVAGVIGLFSLWRGKPTREARLTVLLLACLTGAGLVVSWLLLSTLGRNNDLGLRAIIPATLVLVAAAAATAANARRSLINTAAAAAVIIGLALSWPDAIRLMRDDISGEQRPGAVEFAQSPELWAAMRRYASPEARVANNPLFVKDVTPWPINISWALLADRGSCFAGADLALPFAPLSAEQREAVNTKFLRVFDGRAALGDVTDLAEKYRCDVAVVTRSDQAWDHDPFAASPDYRLAETRDQRWRIYVRK
jgi:hypothetical protein